MLSFPKVTSAREIQRNYRKLFDFVKRTKKPLIVMRNNKPDVAIIDFNKLEEYEAVSSIIQSMQEIRAGKAKKLSSLADLK